MKQGEKMTTNKLYNNSRVEFIPIQEIDPSPFQMRKYFDEEKIKELAASIEMEDLIEPIIIRPIDNRYELIAGERRLRAIKNYTNLKTIQAKIIEVDDLKARRISAAENFHRENYSAIEAIEAIVHIVDAELIEDKEYAAMDDTPEGRLKILLSKLDVVRRNKSRKYEASTESKNLSNKFIGQIEMIFRNLPKLL